MSTLKENVQKVVDANAAMGTAMESFGIPGGVGGKLTDKAEVLEGIARCPATVSAKRVGSKLYPVVFFDETCKGDLLVGNALLITNVKGLEYMYSMFSGCTGLTSVTLPDGFNLPACTNCSSMFQNCYSLTAVPDVLDLSACTNCSCMFCNCESLAAVPDALDLSACTNCLCMFQYCASLTAVPDVLDLSACTNCEGMFDRCASLTAVPTHLTANGDNNLQISFASSTLVSKASVEAMADNLNDLTGSSKPPTVIFSSATKALFTTDEWTALKAKFADKGWNVSPA